MNHCEAGKFALGPLVRTASRAHSAPRAELTQRARVGYSPRCTLAAHVALPPTYALGDGHLVKARGPALWKTYGPRAPRRMAVCGYATIYGSLSESRDWPPRGHFVARIHPQSVARTSPIRRQQWINSPVYQFSWRTTVDNGIMVDKEPVTTADKQPGINSPQATAD